METKAKKVALILSGGGAKGAFQCGAERYVPCHVIEPDYDLGDTLDFSQPTVQASLQAGVRRVREVLGEVRRGGER